MAGQDVATFSTSKLSVGPHTITAIYLGDANYTSSTSPQALSQQVNSVVLAATSAQARGRDVRGRPAGGHSHVWQPGGEQRGRRGGSARSLLGSNQGGD